MVCGLKTTSVSLSTSLYLIIPPRPLPIPSPLRQVNFQPSTVDIPRGYLFDSGLEFAKRGLTPLSVMQDTAIGSVMPTEYANG